MEPVEEAGAEAPFRAIDDVGLRVPRGMPLPVEPELEALVKHLAGLTRGAGIVMAAQEIRANPGSTLQTVLALLKLLVFGRAQQTLDTVAAEAARVDCKQGCTWCCHQSVEVTIPEAILIALQLVDPADPRHAAILADAAAQRGMSEAERLRTGRACPLLVDKSCSVYEDRPLMCRATLASDAGLCHAAYEGWLAGDQSQQISAFAIARYCILGDQAGMRGILRDMGLQDDLVELTQALAAILRDPGIIGRWLAGERAFGPELAMPGEREARAAAAAPSP